MELKFDPTKLTPEHLFGLGIDLGFFMCLDKVAKIGYKRASKKVFDNNKAYGMRLYTYGKLMANDPDLFRLHWETDTNTVIKAMEQAVNEFVTEIN